MREHWLDRWEARQLAKEIEWDDYREERRMNAHTYVFTVAGCGSFPFEMLWLSCAWPASKVDAEKIGMACPTVAPEQEIALVSNRKPEGALLAGWREAKWAVRRMVNT